MAKSKSQLKREAVMGGNKLPTTTEAQDKAPAPEEDPKTTKEVDCTNCGSYKKGLIDEHTLCPVCKGSGKLEVE